VVPQLNSGAVGIAARTLNSHRRRNDAALVALATQWGGTRRAASAGLETCRVSVARTPRLRMGGDGVVLDGFRRPPITSAPRCAPTPGTTRKWGRARWDGLGPSDGRQAISGTCR